MSNKVLITGASGFVGTALTDSLIQQGYKLHILSTQKSKVNTNSYPKTFHWDPMSNKLDLRSLEGIDSIINLAGAPIAQRWNKAAKSEIINSRVKSLEILAHHIKTHHFPVKYLVTASAIGIYANSVTQYYEEKQAQFSSNSFLSSVVQKWEAALGAFDNLDLKICILRIGIVLDANGGALPKIMFPIKNYFGAALGTGSQWQSWIHTEDLVGIFSHALKSKIEGVYNAVAPNPVQQSELTDAIARIIGKPIYLPNVPQTVLKLILGEMSAIVLESQRVCSKKIQKTGFDFKFHEVSAALEDLLRS